MPNLYGSNVEKDIKDYQKLFTDPDFMPDELKIYPCSLIEDTPLMDKYKAGKWHPYSYEELRMVLVETLAMTPEYCRLTRVIRDIPSDEIVAGNKLTNFRQIAEQYAQEHNITLKDIRSREVKDQSIAAQDLTLDIIDYQTSVAEEKFIQYITKDRKIAAFLRLSLPTTQAYIDELSQAAIIREIHVYGQAINVGSNKAGAPQHLGLGKKLITQAQKLSKDAGYKKLAVISAIGTKEYYRQRGFTDGHLYQHLEL